MSNLTMKNKMSTLIGKTLLLNIITEDLSPENLSFKTEAELLMFNKMEMFIINNQLPSLLTIDNKSSLSITDLLIKLEPKKSKTYL